MQPSSDKTALLKNLDEQFAQIAKRVGNDIEDSKADPDSIVQGGFITYSLNDGQANLAESLLQKFGLNTQDLEKTGGFRKLQQVCEKKFCRLVVEPYLDFTAPGSPRMIRIIVDGW